MSCWQCLFKYTCSASLNMYSQRTHNTRLVPLEIQKATVHTQYGKMHVMFAVPLWIHVQYLFTSIQPAYTQYACSSSLNTKSHRTHTKWEKSCYVCSASLNTRAVPLGMHTATVHTIRVQCLSKYKRPPYTHNVEKIMSCLQCLFEYIQPLYTQYASSASLTTGSHWTHTIWTHSCHVCSASLNTRPVPL